MHCKNLLAAVSGALVLSSSVAMAHDGATGIVKERMDMMKVIADNTKKIAPIAMGSADMDLKAVVDSAGIIAATAKMVSKKFPEGSTSMASEAKENIWTNWDQFNGLMLSLEKDAMDLRNLAQAGEEFELLDAFGKMSNNCKKCHTDFRQKKN